MPPASGRAKVHIMPCLQENGRGKSTIRIINRAGLFLAPCPSHEAHFSHLPQAGQRARQSVPSPWVWVLRSHFAQRLSPLSF